MESRGPAASPRPEVRSLRLAICQINTVVGDLDGNAARIATALDQADTGGADLAVFPELALSGYPPEDLVLRPGFGAQCRERIEALAARTGACAALIGFPEASQSPAHSHGRPVADMAGVGWFNDTYNSVAVCAQGRIRGVVRKRHLPNYDVFDEVRQFRPGSASRPEVFRIAGVPVGVSVCEDAWVAPGPLDELAEAGVSLFVNVSSSPFRTGKQADRERLMAERAATTGVPLVYVNLVGGQDDLVFDGGSFAVNSNGEVIARCVSFSEDVAVFDLDVAVSDPDTTKAVAPDAQTRPAQPIVVEVTDPRPGAATPRLEAPMASPGWLDHRAETWAALVLATRDYVYKSGFTDAVLGMSGGIDSSLVAAVAAEALGPGHVHGVLLPSRFSSDHSVADAEKVAANLGIGARIIGIESAHAALSDMLASGLEATGGTSRPAVGSLTDQNLQSRIRGLLLMALANENGWLVLTTGNKSELAVGYSTLYGDTAGAYAVICDLWKLGVYEMCRWLNERARSEVIPESILTKAPSAELAPDQRDDQSLPPYSVLDPILRAYVEQLRSVEEIQALDIAPDHEVARVCGLVNLAEYKRRQSPLGPRVSARAFGRDRRMPIVNRYR